jgi:hypothetical protein
MLSPQSIAVVRGYVPYVIVKADPSWYEPRILEFVPYSWPAQGGCQMRTTRKLLLPLLLLTSLFVYGYRYVPDSSDYEVNRDYLQS